MGRHYLLATAGEKPQDFGKHQPRWLRHPSGEDDYQGRPEVASDEDQEGQEAADGRKRCREDAARLTATKRRIADS